MDGIVHMVHMGRKGCLVWVKFCHLGGAKKYFAIPLCILPVSTPGYNWSKLVWFSFIPFAHMLVSPDDIFLEIYLHIAKYTSEFRSYLIYIFYSLHLNIIVNLDDSG